MNETVNIKLHYCKWTTFVQWQLVINIFIINYKYVPWCTRMKQCSVADVPKYSLAVCSCVNNKTKDYILSSIIEAVTPNTKYVIFSTDHNNLITHRTRGRAKAIEESYKHGIVAVRIYKICEFPVSNARGISGPTIETSVANGGDGG